MDVFVGYFMPFFLVFTRIAAFVFTAPVFSWKVVPVRIKLGMVVLLTVFFSLIITPDAYLYNIHILSGLVLLAQEAIYGLALGLICSALFFVVRVGGRIIERQMGLTMANILDPLTGDNAQPLGMLLEIIFILLFLSINGHHGLLMMIAKSFEAFTLGAMPSIEMLYTGVLKSVSAMLFLALRLSAPILAAFLILMVVLAILARIAPEMNILFISLPVRVGLGLLMAALFMPYLNSYLKEFEDFLSRLIPV